MRKKKLLRLFKSSRKRIKSLKGGRQMNHKPDEEMENILDESPYEMGFGPDGEDTDHIRPYGDPGGQKKFLLLVGAGVLLLIVLIIVFFGTGNRAGSEELTAIKTKVNRIGARLAHLDEIENRVVLLQNQEKILRKAISRLQISERSLKAQLDKLTQRLDSPKKISASRAAKTKASGNIKKKPTSGTKGKYYTVRRGDSLYQIAKEHNLSIKELSRLNKINPKRAIKPGQRLLVVSETR